MVRSAEIRKKTWDVKTEPATVGAIYARRKADMLESVQSYFSQIARIEAAAKRILERLGVAAQDVASYLFFARETWKLQKNFMPPTFWREVYRNMGVWSDRGLDPRILRELLVIFGVPKNCRWDVDVFDAAIFGGEG